MTPSERKGPQLMTCQCILCDCENPQEYSIFCTRCLDTCHVCGSSLPAADIIHPHCPNREERWGNELLAGVLGKGTDFGIPAEVRLHYYGGSWA